MSEFERIEPLTQDVLMLSRNTLFANLHFPYDRIPKVLMLGNGINRAFDLPHGMT